MAKKRVQVEELRQITANQPQIGMVDTYVRPATPQRDKSLDDLASFLDKASSQVAYVGQQKKKAEVDTAVIAAQEYAYASGEMKTYAEARDSGELDIINDPTVEMAYNKAIGIRMGRQLASSMQNRFEEQREELLNKSPEDFDKWYAETSKEFMGSLDQKWLTASGVRLGVVSHLDGAFNNAKQSHLAQSRERREEQLYDAFLVGMNSATDGAIGPEDFIAKVNAKQDELLNGESAYTGTRLNKYMATWLSNQIKNTEDVGELNMIVEAVDQIKAGSGSLGGTGVWQEASQALVQDAHDRIQSLNNQKHSKQTRDRTELITKVEDQMVEYFNQNGNLDNFDLDDEDKVGLLNNTDVLQLKKTITNLLEVDETQEFTLAQAETMYAYFGNMSETQALEVVDAIKRGENEDIKIESLAQWRALETIARNAVQTAGDPYTDRTYRELEGDINLGFKAIPNGLGGFIVTQQNKVRYEAAITDLRKTWMEVKTSPEALSGLLPEAYAGLRGKPWRIISRNQMAVQYLKTKIREIVESRNAYPDTTQGSLTADGPRTIQLTDESEVIETVR